MARQRQWKDRRAWVEKQAEADAKKQTKRYPLWKVIIGFFVPKLARKWRKQYARYVENVRRYVMKKQSHSVTKNERGEWARIQNQADRAARRHFRWLYVNRPFEAGSFFATMSKRNKALLSDYMERLAASATPWQRRAG